MYQPRSGVENSWREAARLGKNNEGRVILYYLFLIIFNKENMSRKNLRDKYTDKIFLYGVFGG